MKIILSNNSTEVARELGQTMPRQVPYAAAVMLTRLSADVRDGIRKRMPEVFDRPVQFTQRGVFARGASKAKLEAEVFVPGSQEERGRAPREYMRPGALGTYNRQQKKTEFLLTRLGYLPPGWVTTPGNKVQLDGNGNMPGSLYKQIINVLQLKPQTMPGAQWRGVAARSERAAKRLGVESLFFVVKPGANKLGKNGSWLPPGVWKHLPGRQIMQMLKFVKSASYKRRLDMKKEAEPIIRQQVGPRWKEASALISERFAKPRGPR